MLMDGYTLKSTAVELEYSDMRTLRTDNVLIQPADVLFVWGGGLIDDTIEIVTHGPSHVALFINESTLCEAQLGRSIGECPVSLYTSKDCRLEVWTDPTLTVDDRSAMVSYAKTLYGEHYDYLLIPLELLHFTVYEKLSWYRENKHRICSTYIDAVAQHVKHQLAKVANPAPVDLLNGGVLQRKGVLTAPNTVKVSPI